MYFIVIMPNVLRQEYLYNVKPRKETWSVTEDILKEPGNEAKLIPMPIKKSNPEF